MTILSPLTPCFPMNKPEKGQVLIFSSAGRLRLAAESFDYRVALSKIKELEDAGSMQEMQEIADELSSDEVSS